MPELDLPRHRGRHRNTSCRHHCNDLQLTVLQSDPCGKTSPKQPFVDRLLHIGGTYFENIVEIVGNVFDGRISEGSVQT